MPGRDRGRARIQVPRRLRRRWRVRDRRRSGLAEALAGRRFPVGGTSGWWTPGALRKPAVAGERGRGASARQGAPSTSSMSSSPSTAVALGLTSSQVPSIRVLPMVSMAASASKVGRAVDADGDRPGLAADGLLHGGEGSRPARRASISSAGDDCCRRCRSRRPASSPQLAMSRKRCSPIRAVRSGGPDLAGVDPERLALESVKGPRAGPRRRPSGSWAGGVS